MSKILRAPGGLARGLMRVQGIVRVCLMWLVLGEERWVKEVVVWTYEDGDEAYDADSPAEAKDWLDVGEDDGVHDAAQGGARG